MRRVDAHVHLVPEGYRSELEARGLLPSPLPAWSEEVLDAFLTRHAIDAAVLSLAPPGVWFGDRGLARALAREVNERTAGLVAASPTRFAGLAVLPLPDVGDALAELSHALDVLHLDGVVLLSNVDGRYPGDPTWAPLMDELHRRGAYVLLHPTAPPGAVPLPRYPIWLHEFPFDTTRAVIDLIWSGTLARCPGIRLQVPHLGGTAPFLAHRIASLAAREPEAAAAAPEGALAHLHRLFYDTGLSNHADVVRATTAVAPLEQVVFGTDWPYAALPADGDPAPGLEPLGVAARAALEGRNIAALVPRLGR